MTFLGIIAWLLFTPLVILAVAVSTVFFHDRLGVTWLVAFLLAINLAALVIYGYDKLAARVLKALHLTFLPLRVPEALLTWGLAFPGGIGGALAAMLLFHHKTGPESADFRTRLLWAAALEALVLLGILLLETVAGIDVVDYLDAFIGTVAEAIVGVLESLF